MLNSNMAQQILKEVDGSSNSFFGLLKLAKKGKYNFKDIKLPNYLKKDGFTTLVIGFVRIKDNVLTIPYSNAYKKKHNTISIKIPPILKDKKIKEIRIIPKSNARFFEVQYTYEVKEVQSNLNQNNALAIDLGINNLCTCVTNTGESFIIDGKRLNLLINGSIEKHYFHKVSKISKKLKLNILKDKAVILGIVITKLAII